MGSFVMEKSDPVICKGCLGNPADPGVTVEMKAG